MSLFDTFDPNSEELIKVCQQRSFCGVDNFPEVVIGTFKEEAFRALTEIAETETICSLRAGRTIPVYRMNWQERNIGLFHSLMGGAGTVCLMENLIARGAKAFLFYGNCGVLNQENRRRASHPAHRRLSGRGNQLSLSARQRLC